MRDDRCGDAGRPLLAVSIHHGVVPRSQLTEDEPRADDLSAYKVVAAGDIVVNRMRAFQGAVGVAPTAGIVSPDYLVLQPQGASPRYLHYLMRSHWMVGEMSKRLRGIGSVDQGNVRTPRINVDELGEIVIDCPDDTRQNAIVDFLDAETSRIDALVNARERQGQLLAERLASMIETHLWSATENRAPALSVAVTIADGQVDPTDARYSEVPLIAPNHIESGTGRVRGVTSASDQGAISGKYLCNAGEVVYSKIRPALRKACVAPFDCLTSADMYPLRPNPGLLPRYLLYFLLSNRFTDFAVMESERVAMPKVNRDAFGRIRIPIPTVEDQRWIVNRLDEASRGLDALSTVLASSVALLRERKQALITAAVTGQLDLAREIAEEAP